MTSTHPTKVTAPLSEWLEVFEPPVSVTASLSAWLHALALPIDDAVTELQTKSLKAIQHETALKWAARATAAVHAGNLHDAQEYWHEALEHAALLGDVELLRELITQRPDGIAAYSEDQPRDDHGKWSTSGAGLSRAKDGTWKDGAGKAASSAIQQRLIALRTPPAWTQVRINPDPKGDLQVVGKDAKGRSQYLYSAAHSEQAAAEKFARLKEFNKELPQIRERIAADLKDKTLPETDREAAAVLTLIDKTGFRVGGSGDTQAEKQAYGASTLLADHARVDGDTVRFAFVGKKGVDIEKEITDKGLAQLLAPRIAAGGKLFNVNDAQVRDYLHSRDGDFKVKDFRTWNGTTVALKAIAKLPVPSTEKEFKVSQKSVAKEVAAHLGNTPSVALASYIDPAVFSKWKAARL